MPNLDIFESDAFSTASLTASINNMPRIPARLDTLGLFENGGVSTTKVWLEENQGNLSLLQTSPRGAPSAQYTSGKRKAHEFTLPHVTLESTIYADELQDVRQFGSESALETTTYIVDRHMREMQRSHQATLEHLRMGAVQGKILDADGTEIYDLFTEFNVSQQTHDFAFATDTTSIRNECLAVARMIEDELGATPHTGLRAFCGKNWFDALINDTDVKSAYERFSSGEMLRNDPRAGFPFGSITFEEYRQKVDGQSYVGDDVAFVVPEGTGLFINRFGPADFLDSVNTMGAPLYSRAAPDREFQRYVKIHTQSNPLPLCLRPRIVVKLTKS